MNSRTGTQHGRDQSAAHDEPAEEHIAHLCPVSRLASVDEAVGVVHMGKPLACRNRDFKKVAQRLPSFAHLVLEEVFWGYKRSQLSVVVIEDLLAVLLEVAFEEGGPEFVQHRLVEPGAPVPLRHEFELKVVGPPVYGF